MNKSTNHIAKFRKIDADNAKAAKKSEKFQVSINLDTYIAKEILYQTALLKQIQHELCEIHILISRQK